MNHDDICLYIVMSGGSTRLKLALKNWFQCFAEAPALNDMHIYTYNPKWE